MWPAGFRYIPRFISEVEKQKLVSICEGRAWCNRLRRQQQYYGIKYFHTKYLDPVLQKQQSQDYFDIDQLDWLTAKVRQELGIFPAPGSPNQVLVNRYLRKDVLGLHVEDVEAFGDTVVGLSIGHTDYLRLVPNRPFSSLQERNNEEVKVKLQDGSIYIMQGQSRYHWKHGIGRSIDGSPFKSDSFFRISFTLRDVIETRRKL